MFVSTKSSSVFFERVSVKSKKTLIFIFRIGTYYERDRERLADISRVCWTARIGTSGLRARSREACRHLSGQLDCSDWDFWTSSEIDRRLQTFLGSTGLLVS
ncbi:hypothetical protein AVEN_87245-1 [Araneus ventricosus]|uniref:Uncharacterized protein n=1 Tax=Araneus ventricosus TaxID=182803 RepID=A0A4Y2TFV7_ARAVE|nr:hypothetical protein AVEN_87245-1 [Araneus ventricosus]